MTRALGDFQTPPDLVKQILAVLQPYSTNWTRVLEPTCGVGNFLIGAFQSADFKFSEAYGIELQGHHLERAKQSLACLPPVASVQLIHESIFDISLKDRLTWQTDGGLLILGNPPWVTNAELGKLGSQNLPNKYNVNRSKGLNAQTGESNFDLAEAILQKLLLELQHDNPTFAVLCKTTVARNILRFAQQHALPIRQSFMRQIDAKRWFGATVEACLLYLELEASHHNSYTPLFTSLSETNPIQIIEVRGKKIIADYANYTPYQHLEGQTSLVWRQGVKHDVAAVMELNRQSEGWRNKLDQTVLIETERIYPLLKGADLQHGRTDLSVRGIIMTQQQLGEDTQQLAEQAPRLWAYLMQHRALFDRRKSSIYRQRPLFSIFGVGQYTFAPYKVAVAGLYAPPIFRLIPPFEGKPVLFDDTCYFIPCQELTHASLLVSLLNHPTSQAFFASICFVDAKRPITKGLLQRLNLSTLLDHIGRDQVLTLAKAQYASMTSNRLTDDEWEQAIATLFHETLPQPLLL